VSDVVIMRQDLELSSLCPRGRLLSDPWASPGARLRVDRGTVNMARDDGRRSPSSKRRGPSPRRGGALALVSIALHFTMRW
jgi:hypothetical protein